MSSIGHEHHSQTQTVRPNSHKLPQPQRHPFGFAGIAPELLGVQTTSARVLFSSAQVLFSSAQVLCTPALMPFSPAQVLFSVAQVVFSPAQVLCIAECTVFSALQGSRRWVSSTHEAENDFLRRAPAKKPPPTINNPIAAGSGMATTESVPFE